MTLEHNLTHTMSWKAAIDSKHIPKHIAIIMDGNGRWAKKQGFNRIFGHRNGVKAVREACEACAELGVEHLTLYAFSTENWNRPSLEVNALMELLVATIGKETKTLLKNKIRLNTIGNIDALPKKCRKELAAAIEETKTGDRMQLTLALSYGSRNELLEAFKQVAEKVQTGTIKAADIDEQLISNHLMTANIPDPELLIRTSGEQRISNFLLWQLAYSELYFSSVMWPEFNKAELAKAILSYQNRERRFGKTSEQLVS